MEWRNAMRPIIWTLKLGMLVWLLAGLGVCFAAGPAEAAPELQKVHILMVFDTNDPRLKKSLEHDETRMRETWKRTIPEGRYTLKVLRGEEATASRILNYYRDLKTGPGEGLVFFYGGHGAIDPGSKEHFFDLVKRPALLRSVLRKAMEAKRADLVVLLSDCCSSPQEFRAKVPSEGPFDNERAIRIHPTVRCLLFQARGTVDVTAATDNAAWSDNLRGGLFTRSVARMFTTPVRSLDSNRDGFVSWSEFSRQLTRETEILFRYWRKDMIARGERIDEHKQVPRLFPQTYAVVGIENAQMIPLTYRFRWAGQTETVEVRLQPKERRAHYLRLPGEKATPPQFLTRIGKGPEQAVPASRWTGVGTPMFADTDSQFTIEPEGK